MFQGKNASSLKGKVVTKVKTITINVNVVDVNVVTRSRITKDQVFQEKEPRKNKSTVDWEKNQKLKKTMVEIIQQLHKSQAISEGSFTSIEGWNTMWPRMFDTTPFIEPQKPQEFVVSQSKLISIEEIFQDINRQMLETSYTLNLGQLLKMAHELNRYLWQKMKLYKPQIIVKTITKKITSIVSKVVTMVIIIDNHMAIIQVQSGENNVEDVLLDGRSKVNIITKQFKLRSRLPIGLICDLKIYSQHNLYYYVYVL